MWDRNRETVAAPDHQRQIVENEGKAERQQNLAQVVAADKAQQALIEHEADRRDRRHRTEAAKREAAGFGRNRKADIAAKQIERAMRQIDDAQQSKDQRKATRHHEQQRCEGQSVEKLEGVHP